MSRNRTIAIMVGLGLGLLLGALDQTIVGTAMPRIVAHLGGMTLYSWVFTSYMLTSTAFMPVFGKLSDIYGRKYMYLLGIGIFMVGSALSGVSQSMTQLIFFRGLQGIGAAATMPIALAAVGDVFPPAKRGRVQGMFGAVFGIASVIGPSLGGFIVDNSNWRWVFYINLPVGIMAVAVLLISMPRLSGKGDRRSVDYLGATTLMAGIVPLLLAMVWGGQDYAWGSPMIIGLLIASLVMVGAFLAVERRAREPIIPLDLFRSSIFSVSTVALFFTGMAMYGGIMYIPLFVQGVVGSSATSSGAVLTPMMLSLVVGSMVAGQIMTRTGRYRWIGVTGMAVMLAGMFLFTRINVHTTNMTIIRNMIVAGVGLGVTLPLFTLAVQNAFPQSRLGVVSSSVTFFRSIGGTVGVAMMGTFLNTKLHDAFISGLPAAIVKSAPAEQLSQLSNPQLLLSAEALSAVKAQFVARAPAGGEALFQQVIAALKNALAISLHDVFLAVTVMTAVAFFASFFLKEIPLRHSHAEPFGAMEPFVTPEPEP